MGEMLSKFPQYEIKWGMLQPESETKIKAWVVEMIEEAIKDPTKRINIADEIFDEIHQVGYEEGYDSAQCDYSEGEGL